MEFKWILGFLNVREIFVVWLQRAIVVVPEECTAKTECWNLHFDNVDARQKHVN
jgi:hypothetical protein